MKTLSRFISFLCFIFQPSFLDTMAENDDKVAPAPVHTGQDYSKVVQEKDVDVAFGLATELDHEHYQLTPEMDRKVRRKIDFILLPLMSITATLSFLDKVSNNYAWVRPGTDPKERLNGLLAMLPA